MGVRAKQVAIWFVGALACAAAFAAQSTVARASLVTYKVTFHRQRLVQVD